MRTICITLFLALAATVARAQQPVEARIAGLERNEEYMSLLRKDALLQQREDSIAAAVVRIRGQLRDDPEHRELYSKQIMQSENRIFEVRTQKGRIIDRINAIEQEWVLSNLDADASGPHASEPDPLRLPDSLKVRNLVRNRPFAHYLASQDHLALLLAQRREMRAVECVNRYLDDYSSLAAMERAFDTVRVEAEALDLKRRFAETAEHSRQTADSLAALWNYIFDNKSYAYDYLLEALRREELLDRQSARLAEVMRTITSLQGETASDELVDYFLRKRVLVDYEISVAETFGLDEACDSLRGVREQLATIDYQLPKLSLDDRIFIQYDSVRFVSRSPYTTQHPIPECRVYERGTIYRILLGTFQTKRPVSLFRNTVPLSYLIDDKGRWCYYAGGFATAAEAYEAQARLKRRGFIRPEVVVWENGDYRNLSKEPPTAGAGGYRVELTGSDALTEPMRSALKALYPTAGISRAGADLFVIGPFSERAEAEKAAAALREAAEGTPAIRVEAIGE